VEPGARVSVSGCSRCSRRWTAPSSTACCTCCATPEPRIAELFGSRQRLAKDAARYAKRLAGRAYAERYWLLLPPRDEGGLVSVPLASSVFC